AADGGPDGCATRVLVTRLEGPRMALDPRPRPTVLRVAISAARLAVMVYLAMPDVAGAALQSAAGGKPGSGGFSRFVQFINRVADYTIPIGAAFSVLGLVWGGILFQAGD